MKARSGRAGWDPLEVGVGGREATAGFCCRVGDWIWRSCISGIFYVVLSMNSGPHGYIAIILPSKPSPQPLPGFSQESFS